MRIATPPGYRYYGGADLMAIHDGAGTMYVGGNATNLSIKDDKDPERFRFVVFRYGKDGSISRLPLEDDGDHIAGRGVLYVDPRDGSGWYLASHESVVYRGPIPGFVPIRPPSGGLSPLAEPPAELPNNGVPYISDPQILDGRLHQRINKLTVAVAQLQRVLRLR